jgi:transposase
MPTNDHLAHSDTAIRSDVAPIFVSLELSRSRWLVTSLSPGSEKMSKHLVAGGDGAGLLDLLTRLRDKAEQRAGTPVRIVLIQEAGLGRHILRGRDATWGARHHPSMPR